MYQIGEYVMYHNLKCIITNKFLNGKLIISPMGNGNNPAQYYTVKEFEVQKFN
jgi:hypothetical protein